MMWASPARIAPIIHALPISRLRSAGATDRGRGNHKRTVYLGRRCRPFFLKQQPLAKLGRSPVLLAQACRLPYLAPERLSQREPDPNDFGCRARRSPPALLATLPRRLLQVAGPDNPDPRWSLVRPAEA